MPIVITPESEMGKELAKWNKPYHYEPFPQMLYRARKRPDGVVTLLDATGEEYDKGCYRTVNDEHERQMALELQRRRVPNVEPRE